MTTFAPGTPVTYTNADGLQKAAIVIATYESIQVDKTSATDSVEEAQNRLNALDALRPTEGHAHLLVFGTGVLVAGLGAANLSPNVPSREVAESIPDFTVDGKLVGFFERA